MYETPPRTAKWPFLLFDAVLLALAGFILARANPPLDATEIAFVSALTIVAAWIGITPFLKDHAAAVKLYEQANLSGTLAQIGELQSVAEKIAGASAQWQGVQEIAGRTVASASDLVSQIRAESSGFKQFFAELDQREKQTLRIEIEKLRRAEQESLHVLVHLLDHVYALYQAGTRSGQDPLIQQLAHFRGACLDAVRRIGLVAHEAQPGDLFDTNVHQTMDGSELPAGSRIATCIACGYTFQGQALRRIVVAPENAALPEQPPAGEIIPQT